MLELIAQDQHDDCPPFATWAVAAVAVTAGIVAVLSAMRYGYYYDELYFIAAGKRLSFSYADQGPFVPLLAFCVDWFFPGSFAALRIPAIIAALVVVVLGLAFLVVVAVFAITGGRIQYGAGIYAAVIATGAAELAAVRSRWTAIAAVPAVVLSIITFVVWATPW